VHHTPQVIKGVLVVSNYQHPENISRVSAHNLFSFQNIQTGWRREHQILLFLAAHVSAFKALRPPYFIFWLPIIFGYSRESIPTNYIYVE
jgi:hypothetical protein